MKQSKKRVAHRKRRRKISHRRRKLKASAAPLSLNLHRPYFDQIAARTKKTEYRKNSPFWRSRLEGRSYSEVDFRNGYVKPIPFMRVQCLGIRKKGKGRGSEFAIRLGKVLAKRNYK